MTYPPDTKPDGVRGCLERGVNQAQNPGIKSNSKMVIFDNHLAPV